MALQNDPRMYSGGAVVVNTQQPLNLYAQQLQRKQAREEALDNYEMNRINRMNEQGVRDNDREDLDRNVLDMKTYYQAHKDKIRKGGTPEAYNYEKMFRDTLGFISESKNRTALEESSHKYYKENFKTKNQLPDEFWDDYVANSMPIKGDGSRRMDLGKYLQMQAPTYDVNKVLAPYKNFKKGETITYRDDPNDKYSKIPITTQSFKESDIGEIANMAKGQYMTDWSVMNKVDKAIENPAEKSRLTKIFKDQFGIDPSEGSDYAIADVLGQLQSKVVKEGKAIPKFEERARLLQQFKKDIASVYNSYRQMDKANQDFFIDSIIDDNLKEGQSGNGEFQASPLVLKTLGQFNIPAEGMRVTPDGNFEYKFDGAWKPLSANTYKAHLRDIFQAKAGAPEIKKATTTKKPPIETYTRDELKKSGWSDAQINEAVKLGKFKVN